MVFSTELSIPEEIESAHVDLVRHELDRVGDRGEPFHTGGNA